MVTRRTTGRGGTSRRRTTRARGSVSSRRRTPRTASTLGGASALALIAVFTRASWPVRIAVIVVAVLAVAAYLVVRARRAAGPQQDAPAQPEDVQP